MKNIARTKTLHELEVIRENLLGELCNIVRFSINPSKKAKKKLKDILDFNQIVQAKEYTMTVNKIKKAKKDGKNI